MELLEETVVANRVRAVYLMPTFHNPTGSVMPDKARRELVRFARATELPIVEDNALSELVLGPPAAPAARSLCAQHGDHLHRLPQQDLLGRTAGGLGTRSTVDDRPTRTTQGGGGSRHFPAEPGDSRVISLLAPSTSDRIASRGSRHA